MDFKDQIKQISERVEKLRDSLQTEEATKNALIMPFLQAMGYDVFNPLEVTPEYICDIGTKKGEKIDYAIFKDGKPVILVECKHWKQPLTLHDNQLLRYFHVSPAKFGILTNGITYRFYTDLETPNKMDETPFLEVDLLDIKNNQIEEINDIISDRLKSALKTETADVEPEAEKSNTEDSSNNDIITTVEELEAFYIVKSILRPVIASERLVYRDAKSYFAILCDDNNRKTVCRLYLNSPTNKQISLIGEDKKETKYKINSLDDIYLYGDGLIKAVERFK